MNCITKVNNNIKKNIIIIVSFLILLQPIIDLIVGVSIKLNFFASAMSLIRVAILVFLLYYFLFINKAKSKRMVFIFLILIFLYLACYAKNMNFSLEEIKAAMKVFYFPTIFLILFCLFEEEKRLVDRKYLLISLGIYASVIVIGFVTNTAFNSYMVAKTGTSGYFYAANEIGGIIAILLPFVFTYVFNKINIKKVLYFLMILSAIIILGTKTPFISLIFCTLYYLIKAINKRNILKICLISFITILLVSIFITKTPIYKNLVIHAEYLGLNSPIEIITRPDLFDHFVLGSRLKFLGNNTEIYWGSDINNQLLGIGYTENTKLAEMDFYDVLYRQGIVGFAIYFTAVLSAFLSTKMKLNKDNILLIVLIILISTFVGHVITAPAVSTFVAFILCGLVKERKI